MKDILLAVAMFVALLAAGALAFAALLAYGAGAWALCGVAAAGTLACGAAVDTIVSRT